MPRDNQQTELSEMYKQSIGRGPVGLSVRTARRCGRKVHAGKVVGSKLAYACMPAPVCPSPTHLPCITGWALPACALTLDIQ